MMVCFYIEICIYLTNEGKTCVALGRLLDLFINRKVVCDSLPESSQTREPYAVTFSAQTCGATCAFLSLAFTRQMHIGSAISIYRIVDGSFVHTHTHNTYIYLNLIKIYNLTQG